MASDDLRLHFGWSQANNCLWFSKNDLKDYASELFTLLFSIISDKITLYLSSGVFRARGPEVTASSLSCRSVSHYPSPDPARNTQTGRLPPPPPPAPAMCRLSMKSSHSARCRSERDDGPNNMHPAITVSPLNWWRIHPKAVCGQLFLSGPTILMLKARIIRGSRQLVLPLVAETT